VYARLLPAAARAVAAGTSGVPQLGASGSGVFPAAGASSHSQLRNSVDWHLLPPAGAAAASTAPGLQPYQHVASLASSSLPSGVAASFGYPRTAWATGSARDADWRLQQQQHPSLAASSVPPGTHGTLGALQPSTPQGRPLHAASASNAAYTSGVLDSPRAGPLPPAGRDDLGTSGAAPAAGGAAPPSPSVALVLDEAGSDAGAAGPAGGAAQAVPASQARIGAEHGNRSGPLPAAATATVAREQQQLSSQPLSGTLGGGGRQPTPGPVSATDPAGDLSLYKPGFKEE
jgi:hypothetical protein